ncbi:MAG: 16S rRNA (uracil(1498)-N(3))-methyltransferase [Syntrophales bacterium]|nr:16S rRNA (uracil(1498)-N(3))-methyltransferase [Syntrophales bacterium]
MTRPRLFIPPPVEVGRVYELSPSQTHYLLHVLRLSKGEEVILFDGQGKEYQSQFLKNPSGKVSVKVISLIKETTSPDFTLFLAQALIRSAKMDIILQKATELGVKCVVPFISERSVSRPEEKKTELKRLRWLKIATEAARQSHRLDIPEILPVGSWPDVFAVAEGFGRKLMLWEREKEHLLRDVIKESAESGSGIFVVVGPEGGFTEMEINAAKDRGFQIVGLGDRILRTETATIVTLALIQYAWGNLFHSGKGSKQSDT